MEWNFQNNIAEIVRNDYRTAAVFREFGINYCCGGNIDLEAACKARNVDPSMLLAKIKEVTRTVTLPNNIQFDKWKVDFLIDYIVNIHHAYLEDSLPTMELMLMSFVSSHKKNHPELSRIADAFRNVNAVLSEELRKQEEKVFPYIKQIDNAYRRKETYGKLFVRTLSKPLRSIKGRHDVVSDIFNEIRRDTNDYQLPEKACTNHQVIFQKLKEIDNDITQHKHLENNLLFPKAYAMEQELLNL